MIPNTNSITSPAAAGYQRQQTLYPGNPPNKSTQAIFPSGDNYEARYPGSDPVGRELGENARVWKVYRDEVAKYDSERVAGWRETIDNLSVFASLFSAILTAFLAQTSEKLEPDYPEMQTKILHEVLKRLSHPGDPSLDATTDEGLLTFIPERRDLLINGLWFASLALSLSVAFFCVLIRQWLRHYMTSTKQVLRTEVFVKQYRIMGMKRWKVSFFIELLPVLMSISLFLFLVGLDVYLVELHRGIAAIFIAITSVASVIGIISNILPVCFSQCPYVTPVSIFLYWIVCLPCFPWAHKRDDDVDNSSNGSTVNDSETNNASQNLTGGPQGNQETKHQTPSNLEAQPDRAGSPNASGQDNPAASDNNEERLEYNSPRIVFRQRTVRKATNPKKQGILCSRALVWLLSESSSEPSVARIVIEALSAGGGKSFTERKELSDRVLEKDFIEPDSGILTRHNVKKDGLRALKLHLVQSLSDSDHNSERCGGCKRLRKGCVLLQAGKKLDDLVETFNRVADQDHHDHDAARPDSGVKFVTSPIESTHK